MAARECSPHSTILKFRGTPIDRPDVCLCRLLYGMATMIGVEDCTNIESTTSEKHVFTDLPAGDDLAGIKQNQMLSRVK